jgi:hypothetical protein
MDIPLATIEGRGCTAEIYEQALPGQFTIIYRSEAGEVLEEAELTGVSTYRQREAEIRDRLDQICAGMQPKDPDALSASGEY